MTRINGETHLIGFFGATYRTSKMYAMYNAAFEALGLNYVYVPLIVKDLEKAVDGKYATLDKLEQEIQDAHIVINATSVGMVPTENQSLVKKTALSSATVVMDLVSHPKETTLLREARERGCNIVYGDRMLFWQ